MPWGWIEKTQRDWTCRKGRGLFRGTVKSKGLCSGQKAAAQQYSGGQMVKACVKDPEFIARSYENGACLEEML